MPDKDAQDPAPTVVDPPEHRIFPNNRLSELAVKWKDLNRAGHHAEALEVLEELILGSTEMFQRLAQHEKFHLTVPLDVLVASAQEKMVRWLLAWQPKKGALFSWLSKCAKNAYHSEVVRVVHWRKRFHVTGDNLEKFFGEESHEVDKHDRESLFRERVQSIQSRWEYPQFRGAIRYFVECTLSDDPTDRQAIISGAAYCWGIGPEKARMLYSYTLIQLREALYNQAYVPHTDLDLVLKEYADTLIPELINAIGWPASQRLFASMGGARLKLPTIASIVKLREEYNTFREIDQSDLDPDTVSDIARKRKRTPKSAQQLYEEKVKTLDPRRSGEYPVFDED